MSNPAKAIRIGTMVKASEPGSAPARIARIADLGFESFEPFFWQTTNGQDLAELGKRCVDAIGNRDITMSTIGMFGNPLEDQEMDRQTLQGWKDCIDNAHHFGATCVGGFTGRIRNKPLTDSLPQYKKVWSELSRRAADKGVNIAFENCAMEAGYFRISGSTPLRERARASFTAKNGLDVVRPTRITTPSSTSGNKASCWARLKR